MTQQTRAVNTARFEQGDTPQGSDYLDLMDSVLMLAETTVQSMSGPLTVTVLHAQTEVSSPSGKFGAITITGNATASSMSATLLTVTDASAVNLVAASATFTNMVVQAVSASSLTVTGGLTWAAEVTADAASTGANPVPATAAGYLIAVVSGQNVGIPYFKFA